jgi:hypothetical protein
MQESRVRSYDPAPLVSSCTVLGLEYGVYSQNDARDFMDRLLDQCEATFKVGCVLRLRCMLLLVVAAACRSHGMRRLSCLRCFLRLSRHCAGKATANGARSNSLALQRPVSQREHPRLRPQQLELAAVLPAGGGDQGLPDAA